MMSATDLVAVALMAVATFAATNLDDIVLLMLWFSQTNHTLRGRHVVAGQYLGFSVLVAVGLPGFLGGLIIPPAWIGLLGFVPILLGLRQLWRLRASVEDDGEHAESARLTGTPLAAPGLWSPQTYGVAAVTFANGGDNLGIYIPQRTYELGQAFAEALHAVERHDEGALERIVDHFSPRVRLTNAALKQAQEDRSGLEGVRAFWEAYQQTSREVHTEFLEVTSSERAAGLFWTTRGVDARGDRLDYDGVTLLIFDADGKITHFRGYYNTRELTRTVGQQEQ